MRRAFFLSLSSLVTVAVGSVASEPVSTPQLVIRYKHFFYGYPEGTSTTNDLIIRDGYALLSND
jgi:hypothetical protein